MKHVMFRKDGVQASINNKVEQPKRKWYLQSDMCVCP